MARGPLRINRRRGFSSRLDPRRQVEGGDIFQRRALKSALGSVARGSQISPLNRGALQGTGLLDSKELQGSLTGGTFDRRPLSERNAPQLPDRLAAGRQSLFGGTNRGQALFGARTSALNKKPFSDFQRRNLGINEDNEDEFRSLLSRRRR